MIGIAEEKIGQIFKSGGNSVEKVEALENLRSFHFLI